RDRDRQLRVRTEHVDRAGWNGIDVAQRGRRAAHGDWYGSRVSDQVAAARYGRALLDHADEAGNLPLFLLAASAHDGHRDRREAVRATEIGGGFGAVVPDSPQTAPSSRRSPSRASAVGAKLALSPHEPSTSGRKSCRAPYGPGRW